MSSKPKENKQGLYLIIAILCNAPVAIISLFVLTSWLVGSYDYSTDDGYSMRRIMGFILGFIALPTVLLGALFLLLATKGPINHRRSWLYVSTVYGVLTSSYAVVTNITSGDG